MLRCLGLPTLVLTLGLLLPACERGPGALEVTDLSDVLAPMDWEAGFADHELTVYREGTLRHPDPLAPADEPRYLVLADVDVQLWAVPPAGDGPWVPLAAARSDERGRFRVGPGPRSSWLLTAEADGFARAIGGDAYGVNGMLRLPEGYIEFGVRPAARVGGVLRSHDGRPLAGETLLLESLAFGAEAVTDAAGRFDATVPIGALIVRGKAPHVAAAVAAAKVGETGTDSEIEIVAPAYEPIRGFVVDAQSEERLAGAVVLHTAFPEYRTVSGPDGSFVLAAPRLGRVGAFAEGREWASTSVPLAADVELRLRAAHVITGRVVDRDGAPVPDARLLVAAPANSAAGMERVPAPRTAADGTFEMSWLPTPLRPGQPPPVVSAYRRGLGWAPVTVVTGGGVGVELRLTGERTVRGRLTEVGDDGPDAPTRPLDRTLVRIDWQPPGAASSRNDRDTAGDENRAIALGIPLDVDVVTDADGQFEVGGLPDAARGEVAFNVRGTTTARALAPDGHQTIDVRLAARKTISGVVVDVDGAVVAGPGSVTAHAIGIDVFSRIERRAAIGADGRFVIRDLPDGRYSVFAEVAGYQVQGTDADAGADDLSLTAEQPRSLDVDVVFPEGADALPATVFLRSLDDPAATVRNRTAEPDSGGARARFQLVYRGKYDVEVRAGRYVGHVFGLDVADGDRPPVRVELSREEAVTVRLADSRGRPIDGQLLHVQPLGRRAVVRSVVTDARGEARLEGLDDGEWVVRVERVGAPAAQRRFRVADVPPEGLALAVPPHGRLDVEVSGASVDGVVIGLESPDQVAVYAWQDGTRLNARFRAGAEGQVHLTGVPTGRLIVFVDRPGAARVRREIEIEDGATATLVFD